MTENSNIKLTFLGAMGEVGCSAMVLENGRHRFLLDYGASTDTKPARPPLDPEGKIDSVLLSHAHVDHCGSLPLLAKDNPKIYASPCTKEISEMLLFDSLKINIQELGPDEKILPFTKADIIKTIENFRIVPYRKSFNVGGAKITYFDGGHIPGSAMTHVDFGNKTFLYTGNYNGFDTRLLKKFDDNVPKTDVLITESTYSDRDHPDRKSQEMELIKLVTETVSNGGVAVIPSFAVGRAQEILLILEQEGIDYPVYMDGMAKKSTTIINRHKELLKYPSELDDVLKKVRYVGMNKHRKNIVKEPCVIITTSGMLSGGPTNAYIPMLHDDENSTIILTGWQAGDSPGKKLLDTGRFVNEDVDLEVKMTVKRLDFSAHVGITQMLEFIEKTNPKKIFCVHGDKTVQFAEDLRKKGYDAIAPLEDNRVFNF